MRCRRVDGTAQFVVGDQDQVVERIADLYMARRALLRASANLPVQKRTVTISALTNEDATDTARRGARGAGERARRSAARRRRQVSCGNTRA